MDRILSANYSLSLNFQVIFFLFISVSAGNPLDAVTESWTLKFHDLQKAEKLSLYAVGLSLKNSDIDYAAELVKIAESLRALRQKQVERVAHAKRILHTEEDALQVAWGKLKTARATTAHVEAAPVVSAPVEDATVSEPVAASVAANEAAAVVEPRVVLLLLRRYQACHPQRQQLSTQ